MVTLFPAVRLLQTGCLWLGYSRRRLGRPFVNGESISAGLSDPVTGTFPVRPDLFDEDEVLSAIQILKAGLKNEKSVPDCNTKPGAVRLGKNKKPLMREAVVLDGVIFTLAWWNEPKHGAPAGVAWEPGVPGVAARRGSRSHLFRSG